MLSRTDHTFKGFGLDLTTTLALTLILTYFTRHWTNPAALRFKPTNRHTHTHTHIKYDPRKYFFTNRIINVWNSLPDTVNNNNNNNQDNIYSAVIVAELLREFTRFTRWTQQRRQVATDLWTKPTDLGRKPACRQPVNCIHHRHSLSLLSTKALTHFTVPRRVEGWVDLDGWLYTQTVHLPVSSHPSKY